MSLFEVVVFSESTLKAQNNVYCRILLKVIFKNAQFREFLIDRLVAEWWGPVCKFKGFLVFFMVLGSNPEPAGNFLIFICLYSWFKSLNLS